MCSVSAEDALWWTVASDAIDAATIDWSFDVGYDYDCDYDYCDDDHDDDDGDDGCVDFDTNFAHEMDDSWFDRVLLSIKTNNSKESIFWQRFSGTKFKLNRKSSRKEFRLISCEHKFTKWIVQIFETNQTDNFFAAMCKILFCVRIIDERKTQFEIDHFSDFDEKYKNWKKIFSTMTSSQLKPLHKLTKKIIRLFVTDAFTLFPDIITFIFNLKRRSFKKEF